MSALILSLVPLAYASALTYTSLFQFKIPGEVMGFSCKCMGYYSMQWKSTDASSLLFNAFYLCRLQFPLCWLYLMVLDWEFPTEGKPLTRLRLTGFQTVVQMNTASFLGANGFNLFAALL